ncbi:MAG: hypothetical protein LBV49_04700 [Azonexus sp.]|jgi:hypothetical protein|nr:hypothetical protein [Azonexus sp.]
MKPVTPLLFLGLAACAASAANAIADDAAAIANLGRINGVALACEQPAIASRARYLMQSIAPKTRGNGEIFEQATSAAFLEQGKERECPGVAAFSSQLEAAERELRQIWPPAQ